MERLLFLDDIMERYRCKDPKTGRRIMREMGAQGKFVRESQVEAYDIMKTTAPEPEKRERKTKTGRTLRAVTVEDMLIPRI